jgi:hypothetical protein
MIYGVAHAEATPALKVDATRRTKLYPDDIRGQMDMLRTASKPSHYAYWDEQIYINCVPAVAYQGQTLEVYGYLQPATLALATDTTLLKDEWDEVIVLGAQWRMHVSLGEHDEAHEAKQNYGQLVNEIADIRKLHAEEWGWQSQNMNYPGVMGTRR